MEGIYSRIASSIASETPARPGVFLDRDGVIIEDRGYVCRREDIRYIDGALQAIVSLNLRGIPVLLVSNQAGVGRGYYGWKEFEEVQSQLERDLAAHGGWLDAVWACAFHPEGRGALAVPDHPYRKPNPGMIEAAAKSLRISLSSSWMIGDKPLDIEAALRAELSCAVHVGTGYGRETRRQVAQLEQEYAGSACRIAYCDALPEAVEMLLGPAAAGAG